MTIIQQIEMLEENQLYVLEMIDCRGNKDTLTFQSYSASLVEYDKAEQICRAGHAVLTKTNLPARMLRLLDFGSSTTSELVVKSLQVR